MDQNNFVLLEGLIRAFVQDNSMENLDDSEIFELFSMHNLTKDFELTISELSECVVDGSLDGGIDGFVLLVNGKYVYSLEDISDTEFSENTTINAYIIQAKSGQAFKEDVLNNLYISLPLILDLSILHEGLSARFNSSVLEKIMIFRDLWEKSAKCRCNFLLNYCYISKGDTKQLNDQILSKRDQILEMSRDKIYGAKINFDFIGARELLDLHNKTLTYRLSINFKETPLPISFNKEIGFIGVAKLNDYYNLIVDERNTIREYIFEDNIRHFQGNVDVNKKIAKTLEDDLKRDFWWLNNGITVIASDFTQRGKTLYVDDLQIVNGLQTSFVIDKYFKSNEHKLNENDEERSILIKVIISKDKETTDKIIAATNSQTHVTPALLRATDDIQRDLEQFFLDKGYYYDRRKNYYRRKNKPLGKIFDIQYTAQCVHAILNRDPATARSKPTSLIKENSVYNSIFRRHLNYQVYLNCCLIHSTVREQLKLVKRRQRTHAASGGASKALPHEIGGRLI